MKNKKIEFELKGLLFPSKMQQKDNLKLWISGLNVNIIIRIILLTSEVAHHYNNLSHVTASIRPPIEPFLDRNTRGGGNKLYGTVQTYLSTVLSLFNMFIPF